MSSALPDPAAVLATYLHEAVAEARIAYEFVPISHTYSALQACLAAEQALAVLRDALEAGGRNVSVADIALARRAPQGAHRSKQSTEENGQ